MVGFLRDKEALHVGVGLLLVHVVQISVTDMLLPCYNRVTFCVLGRALFF